MDEKTLDLLQRSDLINRWLLLRKCVNKADECRVIDGRECYLAGGIVLPDTTADNTCLCSIQKVAKDCVHFEEDHIGMLVVAPELSQDHIALDAEREWWITREKALEGYLAVIEP